MKRTSLFAVSALLLLGAACSGRRSLLDGDKPLAVRMIESEIARHPSPATLDGIAPGKIKWNYTSGLELLAFIDAGEVYDRPDFYDYALRYYDTIVRPDASVITYRKDKYNLDHVCPGRPLFIIAERTGEARYAQVLDTLSSQLQ